MSFQPLKTDLDYLLKGIHHGEIVLPEFQRDFVWLPGQTVELLKSVCRSYPAGTLLFLGYKSGILATRLIAEVPSPPNSIPKRIVLDGQQRLTALYHALRGKGEYRFFFDMKKLEDGQLDYAVFHLKETEVARRGWDNAEAQFSAGVIPASVLLGEL